MAETMALFSNIQDLKKYVGGGANVSLKLDSIEPFMHDTVRDHIAPYLGYAYISDILAAKASLADNESPFWDKVKRSIALLTLYEYSKVGGIQLSDVGIMRASTDTLQSAFKYQENDYRNYMLTKGYEALEELLVFLFMEAKPISEAHTEGVFLWWLQSEGYTRYTELFVRTAFDMRKVYGLDVTRYSYEILRGLLRDVEYYAIEAALPQKFIAYLRVGPYFTEFEKQVLTLIQSAIVHFVIEEGIRQNWVSIQGRSVVHLSISDNQSSVTQTTGSAEAVKMKIRHHEVWAVRHMARLKSYIWEHKAHFPLCFATTEGGSNTDADAWKTDETPTLAISTNKTIFTF